MRPPSKAISLLLSTCSTEAQIIVSKISRGSVLFSLPRLPVTKPLSIFSCNYNLTTNYPSIDWLISYILYHLYICYIHIHIICIFIFILYSYSYYIHIHIIFIFILILYSYSYSYSYYIYYYMLIFIVIFSLSS